VTDRRIEDAVRRGALVSLVTGRDGFAFVNPYLDTPTDPVEVFRLFLGAHGADPAQMRAFADALLAACDGPDEGWVVVYYLPDVLAHAARFGPDFDARAHVTAMLARLHAGRARFAALRRWAGAAEPEGCWGVAARYVRTLRRAHGAWLAAEWG
jgi:hypothetical protein